jgi:hypothetical protein
MAMTSTDLEAVKEYASLILENPQMMTPVALTLSLILSFSRLTRVFFRSAFGCFRTFKTKY